MTAIIAFIGLEGAGKSTTAKYLARELRKQGKRVEIKHLAESLKLIAKEHFDLTKHSDRISLENLAEDMKYYFGDHIFARYTLDHRPAATEYLLIPDLRFIEEHRYLSDKIDNVYIIQIGDNGDGNRKDAVRLNKLINNLDGIHYHIDQKGLDYLPYEVECIIKYVLGDNDGKVQE